MKSEGVVVKEVNGTWDIEAVDVVDTLDANEVLVKIVASGACHSDLSLQNGTIPYPFPAVFGHVQGGGTVLKVGAGVKRVKEGDRVLLSWAFCRTCPTCASGHPAHCDSWPLLNLTGNRACGTPGFSSGGNPIKSSFLGQSSFARHAVVDESSVVKIGPAGDLELLSVLGCGMITGAGTVLNILKPAQGTTLVVFGMGTVGCAALMGAAISPVSKIIAVDIKDNRLELAKKCGATHTINSSKVDPIQAIKDLTGGRGANYAVEASGVTKVLEQAIQSLAPLGTVASIGIPPITETVGVNIWDHILNGKRYIGALEGDCNPQQLVPFLAELHAAGRFPFDLLCKKYNFKDIAKAFDAMKDGSVIKPILVWDLK